MSRIFHGLPLGLLRMHNRLEAFPYAYIEGNLVDASLQRYMLDWLEALSTYQTIRYPRTVLKLEIQRTFTSH